MVLHVVTGFHSSLEREDALFFKVSRELYSQK